MNNDRPTCESWSESIGLLAAECLTSSEEYEVRRHLSGCEVCREKFSQLVLVCAELHAAGSTSVPSDLDIASRALAVIESDTSVRVQPVLPTSSFLWKGVAAALAACVLIAVVWRSFLGHLATPDVVRDLPPVVPSIVVQVPPEQVVITPVVETGPPTLMALRRAAAESDEALDRLLAQSNRSLQTSRLDLHSLD
jgi:hypothetical protein